MKRDEDKLQEWCVTYLYRWYKKTIYHHSPNEGVRTEKQGWHCKRMGMLPGYPDLEILTKGTVIYIEFKTPKGRLSPAQKLVKAWLEAQGYKYYICRCREDFVKICHEEIGKETDPDRETLLKIIADGKNR